MDFIKFTVKQAKAMNAMSTGSKFFVWVVTATPVFFLALPEIMNAAHKWVT